MEIYTHQNWYEPIDFTNFTLILWPRLWFVIWAWFYDLDIDTWMQECIKTKFGLEVSNKESIFTKDNRKNDQYDVSSGNEMSN